MSNDNDRLIWSVTIAFLALLPASSSLAQADYWTPPVYANWETPEYFGNWRVHHLEGDDFRPDRHGALMTVASKQGIQRIWVQCDSDMTELDIAFEPVETTPVPLTKVAGGATAPVQGLFQGGSPRQFQVFIPAGKGYWRLTAPELSDWFETGLSKSAVFKLRWQEAGVGTWANEFDLTGSVEALRTIKSRCEQK